MQGFFYGFFVIYPRPPPTWGGAFSMVFDDFLWWFDDFGVLVFFFTFSLAKIGFLIFWRNSEAEHPKSIHKGHTVDIPPEGTGLSEHGTETKFPVSETPFIPHE